jgi:hypothetical protein
MVHPGVIKIGGVSTRLRQRHSVVSGDTAVAQTATKCLEFRCTSGRTINVVESGRDDGGGEQPAPPLIRGSGLDVHEGSFDSTRPFGQIAT